MDYNNIDPNKLIYARQKSLELVMNYLRMLGSPMKMEEIVNFAETIVQYIVEGKTVDVSKQVQNIDFEIQSRFEE